MRVLLIDTDRCGLDFAYRCVQADHDVRWYNRSVDGEAFKDGQGFPGIAMVKDWRESMKWAKDGLVWTSSNGKFLKELDQWKQHGFPVFAPSFESAQLEISRSKGMDLLKQCGMSIPKYTMFNSLDEALKFAWKATQPYVFKTMGDCEDKSLSYVAKTPADLVGRIQRWIKDGLKIKGPCMLQERVDGVEFAVSCWFGPDGPLPDKWNINFEHKKLMPGNYGPNTGEMGTVIQYTKQSKLADAVFTPKLVAALRKLRHLGDVDVNCIVDKDGTPWPLEFTCRPGWPFDWIVDETHPEDPAEWKRDLLLGKDSLKVSYDVAIGNVIATPPFPYDEHDDGQCMGLPVQTPKNWRGIHPVNMMLDKGPAMEGEKVVEKDIFKTTGDYVMVCVGIGKTVMAAKKATDKIIGQVQVPNMIVRNDIGMGLEKVLPTLHKLGYAENMEFDA